MIRTAMIALNETFLALFTIIFGIGYHLSIVSVCDDLAEQTGESCSAKIFDKSFGDKNFGLLGYSLTPAAIWIFATILTGFAIEGWVNFRNIKKLHQPDLKL